MAIKSIDVMNIMVFQRQFRTYRGREGEKIRDSFRLEFCDGINVLIGENGVGKTTLLKMIYAATQWSIEQTNQGKTRKFLQFFSNSLSDGEALKSTDRTDEPCYFRISDGEHIFEDSLSQKAFLNYGQWLGLNIQSVFIPTTEMLSHSKGFLAMNEKYNMPFDGTQIDIIVNASLPETREIPAVMKGVLDKISNVIDGTVIQEDDTFYVVKKDGRKVDFSLEAEGLRKLGLLWRLIRNGLLEAGTVLLWDEPEANLNPELYPLVAEILLELEKNGVQIFVATHSYNFAKYLEIRRTVKEQVMFHNLYKDTCEMPNKLKKILPESENQKAGICGDSAYRMEDLKGNHIIMADNRLLDEIYDL